MVSGAPVVIATVISISLAAAKLVVAAITGSVALLAAGLQSTVDAADQLLAFRAYRRAGSATDAPTILHGREARYASLVSSLVIMGLGAGASIVVGLIRLGHGGDGGGAASAAYAILGASAVLQGASWIVGARKVAQARARRSSVGTRGHVDPALKAVVAQDTGALLGTLIAFLGILGDRLLGLRALEPVASMGIGLTIAGVSLVLARERRTLLLGESGSESIERVRSAIAKEPGVKSVGEVWAVELGPDELLISCQVEFRQDVVAAPVEDVMSRVEEAARSAEPRASRVFVAVERPRSRPGDGSRGRRGTSTTLISPG